MSQIKEQVIMETEAQLASFLIRINGVDLAIDTHVGKSECCHVVISFVETLTEDQYDSFEKKSLEPPMFLRLSQKDEVYIMEDDTIEPGEHGAQDYRLPAGDYLIGVDYGVLAVIRYNNSI